MKKTHRAKLKNLPDLQGLARCFPKHFPALLASNSINQKTGRYSLLFHRSKKPLTASTSSQLLQLMQKVNSKVKYSKTKLPFYSGWFLYLSYEAVASWENSITLKNEPNQPLAIAIRCQSAIIIDHIKNKAWLVASSKKRIKKLKKLIKTQKSTPAPKHNQLKLQKDDVEKYIENVEKAKKYIIKGDVYQVNLARNWQVKTEQKIDAMALYQSLSQHNPAPFAGILQSKNFSIISSSPERLVKVSKNTVQSRPIAGTRPRHKDKVKDKQLIKELINHPKEQAEHIMLIDLVRNDIGRVSKKGSVKVDEFMGIESYRRVHHIVSNITGTLKKDCTSFDIIKALFPGGTITGCPKIRCIQIISELETQARGAYTGSMGYISDTGTIDLNILIRTFALQNNQLTFHAGAGIVYDSIASKEAQESMHKAHALITSLGACPRIDKIL